MSKSTKNIVSDADHAALEANYRFVPSEKEPSSWQERMVHRYSRDLYREFALADLSTPGKLGLRWRTKDEVIKGRGERSCGNKKCQQQERLVTLEVPFSYTEGGEKKKELVKLRLCANCLPLVHSMKSENSQAEKKGMQKSKRSMKESDSDSSSESSEESNRRQLRKKRRNHRNSC